MKTSRDVERMVLFVVFFARSAGSFFMMCVQMPVPGIADAAVYLPCVQAVSCDGAEGQGLRFAHTVHFPPRWRARSAGYDGGLTTAFCPRDVSSVWRRQGL